MEQNVSSGLKHILTQTIFPRCHSPDDDLPDGLGPNENSSFSRLRENSLLSQHFDSIMFTQRVIVAFHVVFLYYLST